MAKVYWDVVLIRERFQVGGVQPTGDLILFIRFPEVLRVVLAGRRSPFSNGTIAHVQSCLLSPSECEAVIAALRNDTVIERESQASPMPGELHHTSFSMLFGDQLDIYHGRGVQLLCLDDAGRHITLPGIG